MKFDGVEYDSWRQDIKWSDGSISKNVLFVRARKDEIEFHAPVLVEANIADVKDLLGLMVENYGYEYEA